MLTRSSFQPPPVPYHARPFRYSLTHRKTGQKEVRLAYRFIPLLTYPILLAAVVLIVIVTNTAIGFVQEYNAEQTMESLRQMASPTARVMRDTTVEYISAKETVPGDIILFEEGDIIPADGRLIESFHLDVDEALLTGESVPVSKK